MVICLKMLVAVVVSVIIVVAVYSRTPEYRTMVAKIKSVFNK